MSRKGTSPPFSSDPDQTYTHPWLLVSQGTNLENHTFYSISQNQAFNTNIPELRNKHVPLTSYGWRALIDVGNFRVLDCCLFNTTSKDKIRLPRIEIGSVNSLKYECILSKPPSDPDCYVMLITPWDDYICFCRIGDEKFIKMNKLIGGDYLSTAANVDGKTYGWMTKSNSFVEIGFVERQLVLEPLVDDRGQRVTWPLRSRSCISWDYLLEFCGELLLVHMICHVHIGCRDVAHFRIFEVNTLERKCRELRDIGDHAIFLGFYGSMSALCTAESGVKKNSIYYYKNEKNLCVYDIEDRSKMLIKPCPIKGTVCSIGSTRYLMCWI